MFQPHIAVIDDGVNENYYGTGEVDNNLEISPQGILFEREGYDRYILSHGTTCAAIIKKYSPDSSVSSIKILNAHSFQGTKAQLIRALSWCGDNGIKIINISLGTIDYKDFEEIRKTVDYVSEKGSVIIAACNNRNLFTCPASLDNVIGVRCDKKQILKGREFVCNTGPIDGIEITACSAHSLTDFGGNSRVTGNSNSFAAPVITSWVYDILSGKKNYCVKEVKEILMEKSLKHMQDKDFIQAEQTGSPHDTDDIPVILICNLPGRNLNQLSEKLKNKFRVDGYNAVCLAEECEQELCRGSVSLNYFLDRNDYSVGNVINKVMGVFDPDILLVAVNGESACYQDLEKNCDADIKIQAAKTGYIRVSNMNGQDENTELFENDCDNNIDKIYRHIINLYC